MQNHNQNPNPPYPVYPQGYPQNGAQAPFYMNGHKIKKGGCGCNKKKKLK